MGFFSNLLWRFRQWMSGRNGFDALSRDLSFLAFGLTLLSVPTGFYPLYFLGLLALALSLLRAFSCNLAKRSRENRWYLVRRAKVAGLFYKWKRRAQDRKFHRYYKCPACRAELRVPKRPGAAGKRKIEITCPKCAHRFIRRA